MTSQTPRPVPPVAGLGQTSSGSGEDTAAGRAVGEAARPAPLVISVHGTPAPQGSKRHVGRGVMVESSKAVKPWREAVKYAVIQWAQDRYRHGQNTDDPTWPITGPVTVRVTFTFTRPKSHYRTGRNRHLLRDQAPTWPAGKPDIDKVLRSTLDALSDAGVWRDDAQVVRVVMAKVYGPTAGARILISGES